MSKRSRHCSFTGCENLVIKAEYCRVHVAQLRTIGRMQPLRKSPKQTRKKTTVCSFDGCERDSHALGLCSAHYTQKWHGKELSPLRQSNIGRVCGFESCERGAAVKGYCSTHYHQDRAGQELRPIGPVPWTAERVLAEAVPEGDCLVWGRHQSSRAQVRYEGRNMHAYRLVFMSYTDDYVKGVPIHHKCANEYCVNPDHLEKASASENTLEMLGRKAYEAEIANLKERIAELEELLSIK